MTRLERLRLLTAMTMVWLASKVAPKPLKSVITAYGRMLQKMPEEFEKGRTYGVILVPWALDGGMMKSVDMIAHATRACSEFREKNDV